MIKKTTQKYMNTHHVSEFVKLSGLIMSPKYGRIFTVHCPNAFLGWTHSVLDLLNCLQRCK